MLQQEEAMQCPVCHNHEQTNTHLHAEGFDEDLVKCTSCGTVWSVNHGLAEVVKQPEVCSFLSVQSECVDGDDLSLY